MRGDKIQLPMSTCKDSSREHIWNHFNSNVASGWYSFERRSEIYSLVIPCILTVKDTLRCIPLSARNVRSTSVHSAVLNNIKLPPSIFLSLCLVIYLVIIYQSSHGCTYPPECWAVFRFLQPTLRHYGIPERTENFT